MSSLEEKARALAEQKREEATIDWDGHRDLWLGQIEALYEDIRIWLKGLVEAGQLEILDEPIRIHEEHIGEYVIKKLVLDFSGEAVILEPKGTMIVGARGRVDVYRRGRRVRDAAMLILEGPKDSPVWAIWLTRDPRDRRDLGAESFRDLVASLL